MVHQSVQSYQATTANELKAFFFNTVVFLAKYFCEYLLLFFINLCIRAKIQQTVSNLELRVHTLMFAINSNVAVLFEGVRKLSYRDGK